jgi:ankyrin repeat protein
MSLCFAVVAALTAAEPSFQEVLNGAAPLAQKHALTEADRALIKAGEDAGPLLAAVGISIQGQRTDLLKAIIVAGWVPHVTGSWNPLSAAARAKNLEAVDLLLRWQVPPGPGSPIIEAANAGSLPIVRRFVEAGVSPSEALPAAAWIGNIELTRFLIEKGGRLPMDQPDQLPFLSPSREIAELLLPMAPSLDVVDANQRTPLHVLATAQNGRCRAPGTIEVVKLLLERGAKPDLADATGMTPIANASRAGCPELVEALLKKGADPALRDASGATLLHAAAAAGSAPVVELLLARGLDVNAKDDAGNTALHVAAQGKQRFVDHCPPMNSMAQVVISPPEQQDVVRVLLAHGANPRLKRNDGALPLTLAERAQKGVRKMNEYWAGNGFCSGRPPLPEFTNIMTALSAAMAR